MIALATLFAVAFGAATVLPFQSEIVFVPMQLSGNWPVWVLIAVASAGNTLGSFASYLMGRWIEHFHQRPWFPIKPDQLARAETWFRRYGVWSLLVCWMPFGEALVMTAGLLRTPIPLFLALVGLAKTLRYVAVALLTAGGARLIG